MAGFLKPGLYFLMASCIFGAPVYAQSLTAQPPGLSTSSNSESSSIGDPGAAIKTDNGSNDKLNPDGTRKPIQYTIPNQSVSNEATVEPDSPSPVDRNPMGKNNNTSLPAMPSFNSH